jgi:hypothetical protein
VRWIGPLLRSREPSGRWLAGASPRTSGGRPLAPVLLATGPPSPRRPPGVLELSARLGSVWCCLAAFASPATPSARGERGSAPSFPGGASTRRVGVEICARASREGLADAGRFRASFSCDGSIGRVRWPRRRVRARGGNAHERSPESPRDDPR